MPASRVMLESGHPNLQCQLLEQAWGSCCQPLAGAVGGDSSGSQARSVTLWAVVRGKVRGGTEGAEGSPEVCPCGDCV